MKIQTGNLSKRTTTDHTKPIQSSQQLVVELDTLATSPSRPPMASLNQSNNRLPREAQPVRQLSSAPQTKPERFRIPTEPSRDKEKEMGYTASINSRHQ